MHMYKVYLNVCWREYDMHIVFVTGHHDTLYIENFIPIPCPDHSVRIQIERDDRAFKYASFVSVSREFRREREHIGSGRRRFTLRK